ncbi:MAG: SDR family oxidoreductase [Deltaproteobacteria bacterium]|nr:SDR family oxidoreductase [Deltaproteobacteria bacterium]
MEKRTKSAIVTGAARGIGKAIAVRLAGDGYGLTLLDVLAEELEAAAREVGGRRENLVQTLGIDVSKSKQVDDAVKAHLERFGGIDLLVNNAGILAKGSCEETSDEIWDQILQVNLYGPFFLCRAVIPHMKKQKRGVIVNISSKAARSFTPFGGVSYAASKTGLLGLTRQLAHELAPYRIRVNAVCPGGTETPLARTLRTPEEMERTSRALPLGRLGQPEDVAAGVAFLAADDAAYITGVTLDINGGTLMV